MNTIKIVPNYYSSKTTASKAATALRQHAKAEGKTIDRIEVVEASVFLNKNAWAKTKMKNVKGALQDQLMLVIYYKDSIAAAVKNVTSKLKNKMQKLKTMCVALPVVKTSTSKMSRQLAEAKLKFMAMCLRRNSLLHRNTTIISFTPKYYSEQAL